MSAIDRAYYLAEDALARHLPNRWRHVQGVANIAEILGSILADVNGNALVQAAWLHDIGYSPNIAETGFHPLDGARYLEAEGLDVNVVALVANHSAATIEAQLRGLDGLRCYPDEVTPTRDALWYCDAVTGPIGQRWTAVRRWSEIRQRYGTGHLVTRFLDEAEPTLRAAIDRTEALLRGAGLQER